MDIRPFRAWRYHAARAGRLDALTAPLVEREQVSPLLYRTYEHSVHLAAPRSLEQAADRWRRWQQHGVVRQDVLPALYAHSQTFTRDGNAAPLTRLGLIGLVRLNDPREHRHDIRYHEAVRPANVQALTQLLQRTRTAVSPAFGLYDDPARQIEPLLQQALALPQVDVTDADGVRHQLAPIQHLADLAFIRQTLAPRPLLLADGHHRVAAAEAWRDHLIAHGHPPALDALLRHTLFYISNAHAPAGPNPNAILPLHRVVNLPTGLTEELALERLSQFFDIEPMDKLTSLTNELAQMEAQAAQGQGGRFVLLARGLRRRLTLKPHLDPRHHPTAIPLQLHPTIRVLDATVLHWFALDQALGMPYAHHPTDPRLAYHRSLATAIEAASAPGHIGFVFPGVPLPQFQAVTAAGALMPAKTTYFAPKVLSGLVYAQLDDAHATPFDRELHWPPAAPIAH